MVWEFREISVFSHYASVTLSVLSVLIGRSMQHVVAYALTRICLQQSVCKRHCQLAQARAETERFTPLQLSP